MTIEATPATAARPSLWVRALGWETGTGGKRYRSRVLRAGSGPRTVVMLHGQGGHLENFGRTIPAFEPHYRVLAYDLLWHGLGAQPEFDARLIPAFVDQLGDLLDAEGITSCTLLAQSLGGWVGAAFAAQQPERLDALMLVTPMGVGTPERALPEPARRAATLAAMRDALGDPTPAGVRRRMERLVIDPREIDDEVVAVRTALYQRPEVNAALRRVAEAYLGDGGSAERYTVGPERLARIAAPALVYWGSANAQPPEAGREIQAALGDPAAEYHCAEAGHWAHYERSDEFNRVALDFLQRRLPG
jgi:2-hydroxy-6-oxonona-2,4-dienedioate hydrolase